VRHQFGPHLWRGDDGRVLRGGVGGQGLEGGEDEQEGVEFHAVTKPAAQGRANPGHGYDAGRRPKFSA
jgi:hypothetical protein